MTTMMKIKKMTTKNKAAAKMPPPVMHITKNDNHIFMNRCNKRRAAKAASWFGIKCKREETWMLEEKERNSNYN